ncbi:MAG TPA: hypothetical protein VKI18_09065 [Albitalea sp.]|nr:hypothetical protein [Albitalea sp.]
MNRVLSWPHTPIFPGLLEPLKAERRRSVLTDRGMVRFELALGPVEMKFSDPQHQLPPGTAVYVWWKGGGFVCASLAEVEADESEARRIVERVMAARSQIAAARMERQARLATQVDIVLPERVDSPLLHA